MKNFLKSFKSSCYSYPALGVVWLQAPAHMSAGIIPAVPRAARWAVEKVHPQTQWSVVPFAGSLRPLPKAHRCEANLHTWPFWFSTQRASIRKSITERITHSPSLTHVFPFLIDVIPVSETEIAQLGTSWQAGCGTPRRRHTAGHPSLRWAHHFDTTCLLLQILESLSNKKSRTCKKTNATHKYE